MPTTPVDDRGRTTLEAADAALVGMGLAVHARGAPDRMAIDAPAGARTFGALNARANQLVRALRERGLKAGDGVALVCSNRAEYVEAWTATLRGGFRLTPINWHLTGDEIGYIVDNCEARAFLADARFADTCVEAVEQAPRATERLAIGGALPGFDPYDETVEAQDGTDLTDPILGGTMLYTSGTTGRPKGVYRKRTPRSPLTKPLLESAAMRPDEDVALVTGPLYHAAPFGINLAVPLGAGVGCVLMDGWDAEETLRLVERHRITHSHFVPTMFHRMLALPDEVRARYDCSSLRWAVHGAAPCPAHVKRAMIEWLGPVLYEYYAATEGGGFFIDSHEWLRKPGSVGHCDDDRMQVRLLDDGDAPVPTGEIGTVYFKAPDVGRFEYFKAPEKTNSAYRGDYFTMGDLGYLDDDGYLFLTGRSAELIISGGVNIYPAEVDAVLLEHPAVGDAATIGVPDDEWGEQVRSVVQLAPEVVGSDALADELISFCRERLAHYKCPRAVDFSADLPRLDSGKIQRRKVRERYLSDA
ncbi:MAG: AMP-binding protein [Proteobacteria bacterium]|nr:AMP-binding protein [Pseudomonadota bacterium]